MRWLILALGIVGVLLGGLWLLQGLALIEIAPILCVADCEPLVGPSPSWAIIGAITLCLGGYAVYRALRRRG